MGQLVKGWAAELSLANEIGKENRRSKSTKWAVGRISEHFPQKHITPFFFLKYAETYNTFSLEYAITLRIIILIKIRPETFGHRT